MGCFDIWCPFCGAPLLNWQLSLYKTIPKEKDFPPRNATRWLEEITLLMPDKKAEHGFKEVSCNSDFKKGNKKYVFYIEGKEGIPLHTDCWKFAKKEMNYAFEYKDFIIEKLVERWSFTFSYAKYTPINKYWAQDFDYERLQKNKKDWYLMYSPLKGSPSARAEGLPSAARANAIRIKQNIIKFFNKRKAVAKKERPSPTLSATLFRIGMRKKGNDGNMWQVHKTSTGVSRWIREKN